VSSLALMRWLEGAPERYDAGMRVLTFGRVARVHAAVAEAAVAEPGDRILEVGCGTGAVTARMHQRGAHITAIDQSPEMLEQAMARLGARAAQVVWSEQTAAEIDRFAAGSFEAVVLCLCLSDMSPDERAYVLAAAVRALAPAGRLVVADEVRAPAGFRRGLQWLVRIPQAAAGWLLVGSVSQPLPDLAGEVRAAGLSPVGEQRWLMGTLCLVVASRRVG
jgi:demethylmenaquinone methyltransferase/2-methoxy-6-polyprenyl-1,4-benzoquinol methylase